MRISTKNVLTLRRPVRLILSYYLSLVVIQIATGERVKQKEKQYNYLAVYYVKYKQGSMREVRFKSLEQRARQGLNKVGEVYGAELRVAWGGGAQGAGIEVEWGKWSL